MPGPERFAALTGYRYYDVLGVPKQATRSEIRKAYHALALEYHPDRNVIDAQQSNETEWKEAAHKEAMFKSIQEAYSILTDDTKRRMYDQVGDKGIELLMNGGVGEALVNPVLLVLLSALLWILTVLILVFQVLLILRIDQPLRAVRHPRIWSWPVVFTPVWIIDFVPLIFATTLVITQVRDFDWKSLPIVLALFCVTASPITLVLVLVNVFPPVYAFIPLLPALFILIIRKLVSSLRRSEYESMCEASGDGGQAIEYVVYCLYELLSAGLWAAFAVMLTLKLILLDPRQPLAQTGRVHAYTFLVALSPLIAQQVVARLYYLRRTLRCQYIQKMNREGDRLIGPEGARQPSAFAVLCTREGIFHSVFSLICMLFPVSFLVLLGLYLDGFPGVQRFSLVCIPLIIGVGIMNLVSCLLCSALCCSLSSTLRYSSEAGGNYGADDDNVPIFHAK